MDAPTLDIFLEKMHRMTSGCDTQLKKIAASAKFNKIKDDSAKLDKTKDSKDAAKSTSPLQRRQAFCSYCHNKGHAKSDCFKLKKKDTSNKNTEISSSPVAAVKDSSEESEENSTSVVVFVSEDREIIIHDNHVLNVCEINGKICKLSASIDSGSPVSFMRRSIYEKFFNPLITPLKLSQHSYKALDNAIIKTQGFISSSIKLEALPNITAFCDLHILDHNTSATHLLLGRDFIRINKLLYTIDNTKEENKNTVKLFSHVASADIIDHKCTIVDPLPEINIDFSLSVKKQLMNIIQEVKNISVPSVEDNYTVKVNLKDDFTYAYALRTFAWTERIQIREIIDDLLNRNIIKHSTSPYCARVVPVKAFTHEPT